MKRGDIAAAPSLKLVVRYWLVLWWSDVGVGSSGVDVRILYRLSGGCLDDAAGLFGFGAHID